MNTKNYQQQTCYVCGGTMKSGKTTFTVDFGTGVVVIREVPAMVCSQCGMDWINDEMAERIEKMVTDAKEKHSVVEILSMSA